MHQHLSWLVFKTSPVQKVKDFFFWLRHANITRVSVFVCASLKDINYLQKLFFFEMQCFRPEVVQVGYSVLGSSDFSACIYRSDLTTQHFGGSFIKDITFELNLREGWVLLLNFAFCFLGGKFIIRIEAHLFTLQEIALDLDFFSAFRLAINTILFIRLQAVVLKGIFVTFLVFIIIWTDLLILFPLFWLSILLFVLVKFCVFLSVLEIILDNAGIPLNKVNYPSKQDRTALINQAKSLIAVKN